MGPGGNCNVDCSTVSVCRMSTVVVWHYGIVVLSQSADCFGSMVPWGHRFPTSTPSRIADCSGLPPMRGLKGLRISFGSFPLRRAQIEI